MGGGGGGGALARLWALSCDNAVVPYDEVVQVLIVSTHPRTSPICRTEFLFPQISGIHVTVSSESNADSNTCIW